MGKTPEQVTEKWQRRMKGAIPDMVDGVQSVTEAPGVKAAKKADKMLAGITAAIQDGKWANRVAAVPLEEWKEKTAKKIQERLAGGVDAAGAKHSRAMAQILPHVEAGRQKVASMPDLTIEDSIARMTEFTRHMSKLRVK